MTWKEFKDKVEKLGVTDNTEILFIDVDNISFTIHRDEEDSAEDPVGIIGFY